MNERTAGLPTGAHESWISRLIAGQPRALARAITAVENGHPETAALLAAIQPHLGRARIVGVTGPPGAGKSTLIGALIRELRQRGKTVGVLAVDPSSPISGGAILGDRVRMATHTADPGVFVRSLASRGHLGGLVRAARGVVQVMDASGPDVIILETVGSGQSEVEITHFAHSRVVLCPPGAGDDIQAIKAGILEIADILVVNKADQAQAEQTVRQLQAMLALRHPSATAVKVVSTVATSGQGVSALVDLLLQAAALAQPRAPHAAPPVRWLRQQLADLVTQAVRERLLGADSPVLDKLCERLASGEADAAEALPQVLQWLAASGQANQHD
jgi:LAO/AO transport system kinase